MADVIYLLRHAAPPPDRRGRYWGRADPGVDADSMRLVRPLAGLAREKPDTILASPLARTMTTAGEFAGFFDLDVETYPDLMEVDFGAFDGLTFDEAGRRFPEATRRWAEEGDGFAFPGGEAVPAFMTRAAAAWRRCVRLPERTAAVVSHGGILSVWICLFLGLPPERRFSFRPECAALTAFARKRDGTGWAWRFFNNRM